MVTSGRIIRDGSNNPARPLGSGLAGRKVRPMGAKNDNDDVGGGRCTTRYFSPLGVEIWHRNHGAVIRDVCIDATGNIYEVGDPNPNQVTLRKRAPSGVRIWNYNHGSRLNVCANTPDGGVVVGGAVGTSGYRIAQFDSAGVLEWSATPPYDIISIDCDHDGNVICLGVTVATLPAVSWVSFYAADGTLLTEQNWAYNDGTFEQRIVVDVSFDDNAQYPYVTAPYARWLSAFQRFITIPSSNWWIVSQNGNSGIGSYAAVPVYGGVIKFANKKCTGTYSRFALIASSDSGVIASAMSPVLSQFPARDQILSGGFAVAIGRDGKVFSGTTILFAFAAQTPNSGGGTTSSPWVTPPWNPLPIWSANHHGQFLGLDANDAGVVVLGGTVATI